MKSQRSTFPLFFILASIQSMAANFAHPITPTLIQELGLANYSFGLFFAGMSFSNFLFSPMWAKQVKRIGSRKVLLICCIGYAIGQALFATLKTIPTIMVARLISGFFVGGIMVSYLTYIVSKAPDSKKGTYLTTSATISTVFASFGYFVGGMVGVYSIPLTFAIQVITLASCGIGFVFALEDDKEEGIQIHLLKDANPFTAFLDAKKFMTPSFVLIFCCVFISSVATTCFDQSFNYYIKDVFQFSSAYNGLIKAVIGFISLTANATICVWILTKTNFKKSAIFVFLSCTLTLLSLGFISSIIIFIMVVLIFFAFNSIYIPIIQNICVVDAKKEDSKMVVGFYNAIKSLGMIVGALYAGFVYDLENTLPFLSAGIFFFIAMAILIWYQRHKSYTLST